jgi:hypothetical protein
MNVPRVETYALAKKIHDETVPIRGRSPEIRPLGNRRDADSYWVRMDGDDVEFVLYKTPVITYKPSGEVMLFTDTYNTVSTHQFFERVLGVGANSSRHTSVITLGDKRYTIRGKDKLTLKLDASGNWQCVEGAKTQFAWHLHRQKAQEVRGRYKEFITYFKGVVSLRTEEYKPRYAYNDAVYKGVCISLHELQQAFESDKTDPTFVLGNLEHIADTPQRHFNYGTKRAGEYKDGIDSFIQLIRVEQPEETKHTNFYKGALAVLMTCERIYPMGMEDNTYTLKSNNAVKALDNIILKIHASEVLLRKELPLGSVSKGTYDSWLPE